MYKGTIWPAKIMAMRASTIIMAMARLRAALAICQAIFSSRSLTIYLVKTGINAELSAPPATMLKIRSGMTKACKKASEVAPVPNTKANREVRNRPKTRLTTNAPVRMMVARRILTRWIMPVSCAGSMAGWNRLLADLPNGSDGLYCVSGRFDGNSIGGCNTGENWVGGIGCAGCAAPGSIVCGVPPLSEGDICDGTTGYGALASGGRLIALGGIMAVTSGCMRLCWRRIRSSRNCWRRAWRSIGMGCEGWGASKY